jgi:hypothetical protein
MVAKKEVLIDKSCVAAEKLQRQHLKQQMLFDQQRRDIQV